jgi:hypothetical protein
VPVVLKCESLNLLEPSGLVKACNGIALPYMQVGFILCLQALLNQVAAIVLYSFSLMCLSLYIGFACWALPNLMFVDRTLWYNLITTYPYPMNSLHLLTTRYTQQTVFV